ncbi:hypothetical protein [Streptomyces sp. NPDC086989]|uniref:hypothetical protein n=1 Tax=Streptomyces sp. NPDC086989 TaxID=3365764 RepID=UPI0038135E3F
MEGLLRYPGVQDVRSYVPQDIPLRFQAGATPDIDRWARLHGASLMFVSGENGMAVRRALPARQGHAGLLPPRSSRRQQPQVTVTVCQERPQRWRA